MTDNAAYATCDFCGAEHPGPNEPGSCVMFWQRLADRYRTFMEAFDRWRHSTGERRARGADFDPFASFDWEHLTAERSALESHRG